MNKYHHFQDLQNIFKQVRKRIVSIIKIFGRFKREVIGPKHCRCLINLVRKTRQQKPLMTMKKNLTYKKTPMEGTWKIC